MFHRKKSYALGDHIQTSKCSSNTQDGTGKISNLSNTEGDDLNPPAKHNRFLGFFYTFLNSMTYSVASVFVKKLSYITPYQLALISYAVIVVGCLPIAVYSVKEVAGPKKERPALFLRGFFCAMSMILNFIAFRYLPLAEAAIIMSTVPALTTVVAHFYLKETCSRVQVACLLMSMFGVLLSVKLPELLSSRGETRFNWTYLGGIAAAVGYVAIASFAFVSVRQMKNLHFSVHLLYIGFLGMLECAAVNFATASFTNPMCGWDHATVLLIGVMFFARCTMILAIQEEAAGIISIISASMNIMVAMVFQVTFFSTSIDVYSLLGACLVVLSVAILCFSKWLTSLDDGSKAKVRFKCLLL